MVPTAIVTAARARGLGVIGICDHNSAENVPVVKACARGTGLLVLGGMEITSAEEAHMLGFFEDDRSLLAAQQTVHANLDGQNDEARFGCQWIVDAEDYVVGKSDKLLIDASRLAVDDIVREIHRLGGIAMAAHIDREAFSLLGQLGLIPSDLGLDGVEVSPGYVQGTAALAAGGADLPLIRSSDAHSLADIGSVQTRFAVESATFEEIVMALRGQRGRSVRM